MRRVVVTGLGTINPLGNTVDKSWDSLINSKSGITKISKFQTDNFPCKIAGSIEDSKINEEIVNIREQRKIDRFITLGLIAAEEAIKDSGFISESDRAFRSGVMVGSGIGGLDTIYKNSSLLGNTTLNDPCFIFDPILFIYFFVNINCQSLKLISSTLFFGCGSNFTFFRYKNKA